MKAHLSQSLIDEFNLVKIDCGTNTNITEYGFRDFSQTLVICCGYMRMEVLEWQSISI